MFPFVQLPLRSHLLIFGLLCFVPAFLAIAYISRSFALSEQNRVLERADQLTYQFGRNIAEEVAKAQEVLTALATSPSIAVRDWAAFQAQAEIVAGANDAAIALRTPDRQQLINTLIPFGSRPLPVTTDPTLKSADDVVLQTRRPTVSDLYFGASGTQPFIAVIVPVMDGTDLAYLLTMAISPSKVAKGLRFPAGAEYQEWLAVVTGRDERIIARTRNQSEYIGQRATGNMLESLQHAASGQLRTMTLDGVAVHTSFRRNDNGWTTIVSVPNEVLQQPVRALVLPLLAIVATVLVSSALGAWAYGGVIGRELSKLETTAGRVGVSNDLSPSRSSIGEVARIERAMLAANERIKMLVAELDHRVKNTLAIIVSVVSRSVSEERERFVIGGRIMALSVAHEALSATRWAGTDVCELITAVAANSGCAVLCDGPKVTLMPKATIAMAQVFRELLANARQHGALKGNDGAVNVDWRIRDGDFHLAWRETGPKLPVYDGACEFGFGFKVIELCVRRQLGGDYAVETSAEGWGVSIRFPLVSDLGVSVLASDAS